MTVRRQLAGKPQVDIVARVLRRCKLTFLAVGLFSGLINLLALTGSFYMLQVYDRVLPSRSVPTLVGLTMLMGFLYIANGLLDLFRTRIMARVGVRIDEELSEKVFAAVQTLPLRSRQGGDGMQPVRDLDQIRTFLSSMGPTALFDLPWMPLYLAVVFLLHPWLGLFATAGALLLVALTWLTEVKSKGPIRASVQSGSKRLAFGEQTRRNAEVIRAMGLGPRMFGRWRELSGRHLSDQLTAADAAGGIGTITKILRMVLQSGILGLGAYLVVHDQVSAGTILAASITMSRSLAPIETAIAHWRGFISARQSYHRLSDLFRSLALDGEVLDLPKPQKSIVVSALTVAPPGSPKPTIHNIAFNLEAGAGLGIIGPSASGKSTLARALVGVWQPLAGNVRFDGAALDQWSPAALGQHIGYMPQDVELFDGTVAENIARFDPDATGDAVVAAARSAGVHDMIVHLVDGYQTQIGEAGTALSAGQRQRVALARALFGEPFLVVLDEPNSNLDAAGDNALTQAIVSVRNRGGIVIIIAHRPSALIATDQVLAMASGTVQAFGPRDEVLRKVLQPAVVPKPTPSSGSGTGQGLAMGGASAQSAHGPHIKMVADRPAGWPEADRQGGDAA